MKITIEQVKILAKATQLAQKLREESWDKQEEHYTKEEYTCAQEACAQLQIDPSFAKYLELSLHWCNDVNEWAEELLGQ